MPEPRVYLADDSCCIGFWHNITLVDTTAEIDLERMRQLFDAYKQLLNQYPTVAVLCVMRPGVPLSRGDARAEAAKQSKEIGAALQRVAFVLEEGGIVAQLFGTIVRAFNQIIRASSLTVDTKLEDAVRELAPLVSVSGDRERVSAELRAAFEAMGAQWQRRKLVTRG
jgi:hypothetical protein